MTWIPFGSDPEKHPALVDGIPPWLDAPLRAWFVDEFEDGDWRGRDRRVDRMQRFDLDARSARPYRDMLDHWGASQIWSQISVDEKLRMIDWLIRDNVAQGEEGNEELEAVLRAGGSKWKVGHRAGHPGLEVRVPEGLQDAADAAMSLPGDAGRLLSEAWHAAYGMNPQPDLAYRKSIEAVEAVVLPKVTPNDDTATLGKAIGQMRAQGDWKLPFIKEHKESPSQSVVLGMLQALWSGHSDRHPGTASYIQSTQEASEAAVSLSVTLVNLFSSGGISRRP
ncbi:hypothetical protein PFZ55_39000 [Streptomyces sp. MS2A]|nr:hypothetical protein [Streptomyces sp. MS2A]